MRFLKTKTTVVLLAGFGFIAGSVARASTIEQLFLDAQTSAGVSVASATIEVSDLGIVTCTGTCGGLVFASSITPHETLLVTGKLGQFTVGATGVGGLSAFYPTLQNLNQIDAASTGAGNLVAFFTDTDYCLGAGGCFGPQFILSVSTVNDTRISTSSTDFAAFVDGGNAIPDRQPGRIVRRPYRAGCGSVWHVRQSGGRQRIPLDCNRHPFHGQGLCSGKLADQHDRSGTLQLCAVRHRSRVRCDEASSSQGLSCF